MKTFKQLIAEVQQPLSQGEKNFKNLHAIDHKNLVPGVTDQDHVFSGNPRRQDPKTASYEIKKSEDESKAAYDKTLKVSEAKDSLKSFEKRLAGKARNSSKDEGEWSKKIKKAEKAAVKEESEQVDESVDKIRAKIADHTSKIKELKGHINRIDSIEPGTRAGHEIHSDDVMRKQHVANIQRHSSARAKLQDKLYDMKEEVEELDEKHLTPAELKKREEVAKAIARENPGMDKSKKMAIATATAKKVVESALSAKQKKIAKLNPPADKIDGGDLAILRGEKK